MMQLQGTAAGMALSDAKRLRAMLASGERGGATKGQPLGRQVGASHFRSGGRCRVRRRAAGGIGGGWLIKHRTSLAL